MDYSDDSCHFLTLEYPLGEYCQPSAVISFLYFSFFDDHTNN